MAVFTNEELGVDVEIVNLTQRQAVPYWESLSHFMATASADEALGPSLWGAILEAAVKGKWFVKKIDPLDYTPAQARWLADELGKHLVEESQIPND